MLRAWILFLVAVGGAILIDQAIKALFLSGYRYESGCVSLHLTFNKGVAFSMFAFLGPWLKWLQIGILGVMFGYILYQRYLRLFALPLGLLFGAGISNIVDRFIHGGVVDYVDWHCGFEFAIFNAADVMIDLSIAWLLMLSFKQK